MPEIILSKQETEATVALPSDSSCAEGGRRGRIVLSVEEARGITDILANPQPPTEELKRAWREYQACAAAHPEAGW